MSSSLDGRSILVTGGAGFIGCAISKDLCARAARVVVIDNLHPQVHSSDTRPKELHHEAELVVADITQPDAWDELLGRFRPEVIYHLAAETGTGQSLLEAARHANVNVLGTTVMTDALARNGIVPNAMVLSSSRAVYGEGAWSYEGSPSSFYPGMRTHGMLEAGIWEPTDLAGTKASPLPHAAARTEPRPTSIYGATKLAQEHILGAWCSAMGTDLHIFRLQNVYGAGQSPINPYTGIITLFHRQARLGKRIEVYEDGQIIRDFVYIDDVANALVSINEDMLKLGVIDVGTGKGVTILRAAEVIAALHNAPQPIVCGKFRDGDVRSAFADTSVLENILDVRSFTDFEAGAKLVGEWLVERGYA